MDKSIGRVVALKVSVACLCLLASGCLVMGGKSIKYGSKGAMVSEQTLEQIERDETSKAKLVSLLGEPSSKKATNGTEIYKYVYTKKKTSGVVLFLILAIGDSEEQRNELFFEIKDDVVVDWWQGQQDW